MRYLRSTFSALKGQAAKVNFDQPCKIMLMTDKEFSRYKNHQTFTYWGGFKEESPVTINIPYRSVWHVIVELGSYRDPIPVNASVELVEAEGGWEDDNSVNELEAPEEGREPMETTAEAETEAAGEKETA
jgi:hypothetical protein